MATFTVVVSEDLKNDIKELKLVDWSRVARDAIQSRVNQLRIIKSIAAKSKLTEAEVEAFSIELGRKVKKGIHEKHIQKYGV